MDENMSEDDVNKGIKETVTSTDDNNINDVLIFNNMESADCPKRFKTDNSHKSDSDSLNSKESGSSISTEPDTESSSNTEHESATTSNSDSGFPKARNAKNRNYRSSFGDDDSTRSSTNDENESTATSGKRRSDSEMDMSEASESSCSTAMVHDTETESEGEEHPVLKKEKPKHNWFIVPEMINRQFGYSSNKQSSELFQRRCYGSLHCAQRLELMYKLEKHQGCVNSLNFHPNGSLLASGSDDLKCVIWNWKIGAPLLSFDTKHRANVFQTKFLPLSGDLHVVTAARDGQVRLAQVSAQEGLKSSRRLGSHRGACHKLTVLQNQPHVVLSAGEDGVVFSHDVRNSRPDKVLTVRSDSRDIALYSISANPLKNFEFCVSGREHIVRTFDQRKCGTDSPPLNTYYPKKNSENEYTGLHVTCAVYNCNGSEILASYNDDDIYIFDVNCSPGSFVHQYQGHRNGATIKGVNFFGPKSEYIVSGSDCGYVYIWDKNTESIVNWLLADDSGVVNCLEPHPQLPFLATSGLDWDIKFWVPSCENEPEMKGLAETVRSNSKARAETYAVNDIVSESQMLWLLWRHLRGAARNQRNATENLDFSILENSTSDSSSSLTNSDTLDSEADSDDDLEDAPGCTQS